MSAERGAAGRHRADPPAAILQEGFRPFFLGAGLWAVLAMALWLAVLQGAIVLPSRFDPLTWHSHEMLFGFAGAAIAGFLLTAVPNWTGRLPVKGWPLALLFSLWLAGRLAVMVSDLTGALAAALIDLAFLTALCAILLREIVAGRNWRNLPVAAVAGLLLACNLLVHLEYLAALGTAALGLRLALATIVVLITLIGGRIIPSFTRNWLNKRKETAMPTPFGRFDRVAIAISAVAGLGWAAAPDGTVPGLLCVLAAVVNFWRMARWRGHRTLVEPLLWVLHLGYGWLAAGLGLLGLSLLYPAVLQSAAIHALTAGAMGTMILAVMTRATLGHTGRPLTAGLGTTAIYLLATLAALLRLVAPWLEAVGPAVLVLSALSWIGAFGLFVLLYAPLLTRPRRRT